MAGDEDLAGAGCPRAGFRIYRTSTKTTIRTQAHTEQIPLAVPKLKDR